MLVVYRVAALTEFEELKPKVVEVNGLEIAVYKVGDGFVAYSNTCPHEAGPACEGILDPNVACELDENKRYVKHTENDKYNIVCPWHGIRYDLETGVARITRDGRQKLMLRKFDVLVENGDVAVRI